MLYQTQQVENSCEIMGIAGVIVQIALGVLSFSVLIIKRYQQYPKRPWRIWAMDTSKQAVSQTIAHFINVGISLLLSNHFTNDACIWYFITNVLDNTIGVMICCGVLTLVEKYVLNNRCEEFKSVIEEWEDESETSRGSQLTHYSTLEIISKRKKISINVFAWVIQFLIWNIIVATCKSILFLIQLAANVPLNAISQFLLGWLQPYPTWELIFVIIIIPVFMNAFAFWFQDNFLMKGQSSNSFRNNKEPLM